MTQQWDIRKMTWGDAYLIINAHYGWPLFAGSEKWYSNALTGLADGCPQVNLLASPVSGWINTHLWMNSLKAMILNGSTMGSRHNQMCARARQEGCVSNIYWLHRDKRYWQGWTASGMFRIPVMSYVRYRAIAQLDFNRKEYLTLCRGRKMRHGSCKSSLSEEEVPKIWRRTYLDGRSSPLEGTILAMRKLRKAWITTEDLKIRA